jgi:hypothetical protein
MNSMMSLPRCLYISLQKCDMGADVPHAHGRYHRDDIMARILFAEGEPELHSHDRLAHAQ